MTPSTAAILTIAALFFASVAALRVTVRGLYLCALDKRGGYAQTCAGLAFLALTVASAFAVVAGSALVLSFPPAS